MINDNITWDSKPGYNLIEYEEGSSLTIRLNCRHGLNPLSKVMYDHDNVLMPPNQIWVAIHKIHPPLGEGTDSNEWMEKTWVRAHFLSEHLAGVTLINRFDEKFSGLSQARIDEHHKPHYGSHLEQTQLLRELNNDA
jgi:hypothetical protein